MKKFEIKWTDLAKAFAEKCGGLSVVEERVRGEIAEIEINNIEDLMFHVVMMDGADFICTPINSATMQVDTATYEEIDDKISDGPFSGKTISMPIADSEDR